MRKIFILCLYATVIFSSCDTDSDERSPDYLSLALEEVRSNQSLLDKVYEETAKRVTGDTIRYAKNNASSLEEFSQIMSRITDGLFEETIKSQDAAGATDFYIKLSGLEGDLEELSQVLELDDPFNAYTNLITKKVKSLSETGSLILLKAYKAPDGTTHRLNDPRASATYDQVMGMLAMKDILISPVMSEEEQEEAVDQLVIQAEIPEVMIGLLLPAVQKYADTPTNDPFLNWLNTEIGPEKKGGLDRDIIRRIAFAGFLGGLDLLAGENFNNANQHSASIQLMQARYETRLIFIWAEVWDQ